jgi:DNA (cytosine-5)-methyltransferase 1
MKITGFPDEYILKGNMTQQKKFVGNAVTPIVPQRWTEALVSENLKRMKRAA